MVKPAKFFFNTLKAQRSKFRTNVAIYKLMVPLLEPKSLSNLDSNPSILTPHSKVKDRIQVFKGVDNHSSIEEVKLDAQGI